MSVPRQQQIGFSQRIRLEWLARTAGLVAAGVELSQIETALREMLRGRVSVGGDAVRGNREKVITILAKVWACPPGGLVPLRDAGLAFLSEMPTEENLAIHWGMAMAVYPFFGAVAEQVGRLLKLQDEFGARHLQRRLRERYGERETVHRAARRVVRSMVDWGVLADGAQRGIYCLSLGPPRQVQRPAAAWLMEAVLHALGRSMGDLTGLAAWPGLFPFNLPPLGHSEFERNFRVRCEMQGLDRAVLALAAG